jgi:hypothetical protein
MYDTAKRGMAFAVATGGLLLSGPACATAAAAAETGTLGGPVSAQVDAGADHAVRIAASTGGGVLSGNSVNIPATIGLNLCGNGVSLLGLASSSANCSSSSGAAGAGVNARSTHHNGLLSGNSVRTPIGVPVNVCGNSVTIAGIGGSTQGSNCSVGSGSSPKAGIGMGPDAQAGGAGLLSANDVEVPITVPFNVCGDGVSALSGGGSATVSCGFAASVAVQKVTTQTGYTDASAGAGASANTGVGAGAGTATGAQTGTGPAASAQAGVGPGANAQAGVGPGANAQAGVGPAANAGVPQASSTTLAVPAVQIGGAPKSPGTVVPATLPQAAAKPAAPQAAVPQDTAPQADLTHAQLPITVHPMVIWPRPEPAALAIPHPETPADIAAQHGPLADPSDDTLAHTGADTLLPVGLAAGALSSGAVLLATGRRRRRN